MEFKFENLEKPGRMEHRSHKYLLRVKLLIGPIPVNTRPKLPLEFTTNTLMCSSLFVADSIHRKEKDNEYLKISKINLPTGVFKGSRNPL